MQPITCYDFFRSFYYSNTYLPPVDLSEQVLSEHLLEKEDPQTAAIAQKLISHPEVQQVLSARKTLNAVEINRRDQILQKQGFQPLCAVQRPDGSLVPTIDVIEHPDLPSWVIKSVGSVDPE